jgi:NADPH-dependent 2,4-dienoyl-CoA reductase/sulfur reductase-like enzyme
VRRLAPSDHVIVVGAGLAGWRVVESLRREGFTGALTLIGDEPHAPYDRPPLSKQVLSGKWDVEKTTLASSAQLAESAATLRLGLRATRLDVEGTTVELADGSLVTGTHVVLATGSRARAFHVDSVGELASLRTRDDVVRFGGVLDGLIPGSVVAVIGGGFVGAEAATSLHTRGLRPIVLEAAARPLLGVVGGEVATWLERLPAIAGVELRTNQRLLDVVRDDVGYELLFNDGTQLRASAVLAAVGSALDTSWLEGTGLVIDDGVVVDENLQAAANVAAIGDVARFLWRSSLGEESVRIEHWQVAIDHAAHVAKYWVSGEGRAEIMVPYFWSDQYGKKIQMLGHPHPSDEVALVSGTPEEGKWLALFSRDGVVTGIIALSQPRALMLSRELLTAPTTLDDALGLKPWVA